jgi:hypothetical protein
MDRKNIRTYVTVIVLLTVAYPLGYVGARSAHLLVRTSEAIDWTGLPSKWSNRIVPGRGWHRLGGIPSWYLFYPAHRAETWYRNRPAYFFP